MYIHVHVPPYRGSVNIFCTVFVYKMESDDVSSHIQGKITERVGKKNSTQLM